MKSKIAIAFIVGLLAVLTGCKKPDPMVGTWKLQLDPSLASKLPQGMKIPEIKVEFKDGGKFTLSGDEAGKTHTVEGTYTIQEKTVTMTAVTEDGKPVTKQDAQSATLSDDMKSFDLPGSNGMGKLVKQ